MVVHPGNLNGPVEILSFHEMVESNAVPYCILLPYVEGMQDGYRQLAALSNYERLTQTLRERKSVSDACLDLSNSHPSSCFISPS